jgi:hypothetical protein
VGAGQGCARLGHVQMRRGKAEASTGPATEEGGGAVQDNDEQLRGVQDDGVQGSHARCGRSCSAAAAGGSAREQ